MSKGHAQHWKYGSRATQPGELVQVDHMSVSINGVTLKEFNISPFDKHLIADATAEPLPSTPDAC